VKQIITLRNTEQAQSYTELFGQPHKNSTTPIGFSQISSTYKTKSLQAKSLQAFNRYNKRKNQKTIHATTPSPTSSEVS
jgi:hypothetical protein